MYHMKSNIYINFLNNLKRNSNEVEISILESLESGFNILFEGVRRDIKDFQLMPMGFRYTLPPNWNTTGFEHSVYGAGDSEKDAFDKALEELKTLLPGTSLNMVIEQAAKKGLSEKGASEMIPFLYGIRFNLA